MEGDGNQVIYLKGLEIPCIYMFLCKMSNRNLDKRKKRLEELEVTIKEDSTLEIVCCMHQSDLVKSSTKDISSTDIDMDLWIKIKNITLANLNRRLVVDENKLIDKHINGAQRLLNELVLFFLQ